MEKYYIYEETIIFDYKLSIGTNNKIDCKYNEQYKGTKFNQSVKRALDNYN